MQIASKILFLVLVSISPLLYAEGDICFDDLAYKESFDFFEVRSGVTSPDFPGPIKNVEVTSFYKESVIKTYARLIQFVTDKYYNGSTRERNIVIIHLTNEEFEDVLKQIETSEFVNGGFDFHSQVDQIRYRMYVSHKLNRHCKKDFIFVRDIVYMDQNFLHLLAHEFFHILRSQHCGDCTNHLWLEEGLAEYVASKTSGLLPTAAIASFSKLKEPISFLEMNPEKFGIAHYGQSFLFLDLLFRNDLVQPFDSINNGSLKDFIRAGSTSCDLLRIYFGTSQLVNPDEDITCDQWRQVAYKEFIFSLVDKNLSRGGPVVTLLGTFGTSGSLEANYSFSMINVTPQVSLNLKPRIQSVFPIEAIFMISTKYGETAYVPEQEFESTISNQNIEDIVDIKLVLFNFGSVATQYRIDFVLK